MKVVVVGFKVAEENSVYYHKADVHIEGGRFDDWLVAQARVGKMLLDARDKGAEFVSVRFIKEAGE